MYSGASVFNWISGLQGDAVQNNGTYNSSYSSCWGMEARLYITWQGGRLIPATAWGYHSREGLLLSSPSSVLLWKGRCIACLCTCTAAFYPPFEFQDSPEWADEISDPISQRWTERQRGHLSTWLGLAWVWVSGFKEFAYRGHPYQWIINLLQFNFSINLYFHVWCA